MEAYKNNEESDSLISKIWPQTAEFLIMKAVITIIGVQLFYLCFCMLLLCM